MQILAPKPVENAASCKFVIAAPRFSSRCQLTRVRHGPLAPAADVALPARPLAPRGRAPAKRGRAGWPPPGAGRAAVSGLIQLNRAAKLRLNRRLCRPRIFLLQSSISPSTLLPRLVSFSSFSARQEACKVLLGRTDPRQRAQGRRSNVHSLPAPHPPARVLSARSPSAVRPQADRSIFRGCPQRIRPPPAPWRTRRPKCRRSRPRTTTRRRSVRLRVVYLRACVC